MNHPGVRFVCALVFAGMLAEGASAGVVDLISRAATFADTAAGFSTSGTFSADSRYVVFASAAPNLVGGVTDSNAGADVFLFDRIVGSTILVSASAADGSRAANGISNIPAISADGRYVVFQSTATDLVPGQLDTNGKTDIFLFDRMSATTTLVSHAVGSAAGTGSGVSENAAVSGDGRYVAFQSTARDLVAGQSGPLAASSIFLFDRSSGSTVLVSHASGAAAQTGSSDSRYPSVAADGSTIAFFSFASDLVAGQGSPNFGSVFAFDRASGVTRLVSHATGSPAAPANRTSDDASLSADGRYVVYRSSASNLVPGQVSVIPAVNVFLHDRILDSTVLVSRKAGFPATGSDGYSDIPLVSADGSSVIFMSTGSDLVTGFVDGNGGTWDVFLYDRVANTVSLVSRHQGSTTAGGNGGSFVSGISADGRRIVISSSANDLVAGQLGGVGTSNAFLLDRLSGEMTLVSHVAGAPLSACNGTSSPAGLSGDGGFLILQSFSTDVQPGVIDDNGTGDLFLYDVGAGSNALITRRAPDLPGLSADGGSGSFSGPVSNSMSDDGRFVVYVSYAKNLVAGQVDAGSFHDVFLADRVSRTSTLVSHVAGAPTTAGNAESPAASVSADGRWVAFMSYASDLVAGVVDTNGHSDVFLHDRLTGTNVLVTRSAGTMAPANGDSSSPFVSRDGRFVVFTSVASDLVAGQSETSAGMDVFLYDHVADSTTLVSHRAGLAAAAGNGYSAYPVISRDGAFVAFYSGATDLAGGRSGAFLFERATGLVTFVGPADGFRLVALSLDGNWVAFQSSSSAVVPGQVGTPATVNIFLFDRISGATRLVSHQAGSAVAAGSMPSVNPSLSEDGRFVAFASYATDLLTSVADSNSQPDVFLFDRTDGVIRLLSAASGGAPATANGGSGSPVVSADGNRIAFVSGATNLIPGQISNTSSYNVFLCTVSSSSLLLASGAGSSPVKGGNDDPFEPSLSADGGVVVFASMASDLVPGDFNAATDVFAFQVAYSAPATTFYPLAPCRAVDTRGVAGPFGAPALVAGATRQFTLLTRCGVPLGAVAVSVNVTAVGPTSNGVLTFHPAGFAATSASTLSYSAGQVRACNAILGLGGLGATAVDVSGTGSVDLVLDVNGYFK